MSSAAIEQIELSMKQAKQLVELGASLEKLQNNRDFKKVVTEGYFRDEAVRLVHAKANPAMQQADKQADVIRAMDAIGALAGYFQVISIRADQAAKALEDDEAALEEMRLEEGEV